MKNIMALMLGLSLLIGSTVAFAQTDTTTTTTKKMKKMKKMKQSTTDTTMTTK